VDDADHQQGLSGVGRNINGGTKSGISPIQCSAPVRTAAIKEAVMRGWPVRGVVILIVLVGAIGQDVPAPFAQRAPAQKQGAPGPAVSFASEPARVPPVPVAAPLAPTPKPTPAVPAEPTEPVDGPCGSNPCAHPVPATCPAGTVAILREAITCQAAPPVTTCPPGTHAVLGDAVTCEGR
jgi:hypothetical protein